MNINRNNYEEYFLLFVDDELKADERSAVENFAKQNPDLAIELEMLQQAILAKDQVQFHQKELLFKNENTISLDNYEEYFLLSVDNELDEEQKNEVEKFVLQHPQLQDEFTTLQQTKLEPENIAFIGREQLLKKEKERRILPVSFMKMSIAAAVIGLIAFTWMYISGNNSDNGIALSNNLSKEAPEEVATEKLDTKPVTEQAVAPLQKEKNNIAPVDVAVKARKSGSDKAGKNPKIEVEKNELARLQTQNKPPKETVKPESSIAQQHKPVITLKHNQLPEAIALNNNSNKSSNRVNENSEKTSLANRKEIADEPMLATNALYREIDHDDEEKVLYIGAARINKNKLKGLFKKATLFIDKKIGRNDSEIIYD